MPETDRKAGSKSDWKKKRVHEGVTLPSGFVVDLTLPNLPQMLKTGKVPNGLVEKAIAAQNQTKVTKESLEELWEFYCWLVPQMVVKPPGLTEEDAGDIPVQDIELLVSFASRITDMDAVGHQLGGLETQRSFRDLRGIITTNEDLLGT